MNITVLADNQRELASKYRPFKYIDSKRNKFCKNYNINMELDTA
jgi:hypothetical protein